MKKLFDFDYSPEYVLSDGDPGIRSAIDQELPNTTKCLCWFHIQKNLKLKYNQKSIFNLEITRYKKEKYKCFFELLFKEKNNADFQNIMEVCCQKPDIFVAFLFF